MDDLYAGAGKRFGDDTTPNSKWWDGTSSNLTIDSISDAAGVMTFRCALANIVDPPTGATLRRESKPNQPIPDNSPVGLSDSIDIAEAMTLADLKVGVDITHSYRGDLQVSLTAPWGASIVLHAKNQGGNADDLKATFNAANLTPLGEWRGRQAQGAWRLDVKDLAAVDTGRLNGWFLELTPTSMAAGPVVLEENPGALVPDNQPAGIERLLTTAAVGTVGDLEVALDISHTYIGDLKVSLVSPKGTTAMLHDRTGAQTDNILKTSTKAMAPELAAMVGQTITGEWRLRVSDNEQADIGKLNGWKLTIRPS